MINLEFNTLSGSQRLRKSDFGLKATTPNQVSILEVGVFLLVKKSLENIYLGIGKVKNFSAGKLQRLKLFVLLHANDDFQWPELQRHAERLDAIRDHQKLLMY